MSDLRAGDLGEDAEQPKESKGERTRRRLLEIAVEQFGRHGYRGTSVSEITRSAGLTQAASYAYFDSKEALFREAVNADAEAMIHAALGKVGSAPPNLVIPALLLHLGAELEEHPLARRVVEGREPEAMEQLVDLPAIQQVIDALSDRLTDGQHEGLVRPDIDPGAVARGVAAISLGLLMSSAQTAGGPQDEVLIGVAAVFDAVVRPPGH